MFDLRFNGLRLAILLVGASAQAATISVIAVCQNIPFGGNSSISCSYDGVTASAFASGGGGNARAEASFFGNSGIFSNDRASADYRATLVFAFSGGTGAGYYIPCLSIQFNTSGRATLGPDTADFRAADLCGFGISPQTFGIPFDSESSRSQTWRCLRSPNPVAPASTSDPRPSEDSSRYSMQTSTPSPAPP
jgi:hypothetical protein